MQRAVRDIALILLSSLAITGARAAGISEPAPAKWPPRQPVMSASLGHSKDATKESFTQGHPIWLVKLLFSSSVCSACVVEPAARDTEFVLLVHPRLRLFGSAFYFSSLCNKAPPAA